MNDDGTITIGTQISTSQMEAEMKRLYKELEKYDNQAKALLKQKATLEIETQKFEELEDRFHQLGEEYDKMLGSKDINYSALSDVFLEHKRIGEELTSQREKYESNKQKIGEIYSKLRDTNNEQEKIKGNLGQIKTGLSQIGSNEQLSQSLSKIGKGFDNISKKVVRFGLSLLGASTIYGALSRATHTYLSANEETAQKLNSIWTALGNLIGPIIEKVAEWIWQFIGYLNIFLKTISGGKIDLSKNMNKNTKSIKATTGAMKELNKQITQFDEATKLQSNSKLDSGGGGGLGDTGNVLTDLNNIELNPDIEKKITTLAETVKKAVKHPFKTLWEAVYNFHTELNNSIDDLHNEEKILKAFRKETDKSKQAIDNLRNKAKDNNLTTEETAIVVQNLNSKLDDNISLIKGSNEAIKDASNMGWGLSRGYKEIEYQTYRNEKAIRRQMDAMKENILAGRELRLNGKLNEEQQEAYKQKIIEVRNEMIQMGGQYGILGERGKENIALINMEIRSINGMETATDRAILKMMEWNLTPFNDKKAEVTISQRIVSSVSDFANFSRNFAEAILLAMKTSIESLNIANSVKSSMRKAFGLASGGIINLPGAGVPLTNGVIGGERGAEGVIPLTDSQQMEILGEAIGKYITINASITNTMNGRVISRELQKINGENDFASNR